MPTIQSGTVAKAFASEAATLIVAPASGGSVRMNFASDTASSIPQPRRVYGTTAISVPADCTVIMEAVGGDATYSNNSGQVDNVDPATFGSLPTVTSLGKTINYRAVNGATPTYESGFLSSLGGQSGARYWYGEFDMGDEITRMGAEFKYDAGSTGVAGAVALIAWATPITDGTSNVPRTGCHLVISRYRWVLSKFTVANGSETIVATGAHDQELTAGTTYSVELVRDIQSSTAYILLPGGRTAVVTDADIAAIPGKYACFEYFQNNGSNDDRPLIRRTWFDTGDQFLKMPASLATVKRAARAPATGKQITSVTSSALPNGAGAFALLDSTARFPASYGYTDRRVRCQARVWVNLAASRSIVLAFKFINEKTGAVVGSDQHVVFTNTAAGAFAGFVELDYVKDLAAGTASNPLPLYAELWGYTNGAGDTMTVDVTKPISMSVTPLGE